MHNSGTPPPHLSLSLSLQDYPSVGQIAEKLRQFDIIPIFAAEENAKPFYDVRGNDFFLQNYNI